MIQDAGVGVATKQKSKLEEIGETLVDSPLFKPFLTSFYKQTLVLLTAHALLIAGFLSLLISLELIGRIILGTISLIVGFALVMVVYRQSTKTQDSAKSKQETMVSTGFKCQCGQFIEIKDTEVKDRIVCPACGKEYPANLS